jgi:NitT/TauT family transport system substrate-binding protein
VIRLRIYAARHSAFYSPLLATFCAGFLDQEGLEASYAVLPAGSQSRELIRRGEAHIVQSAVSSNWGPLEAGETELPLHFAQINCRDGFFLTGRQPPPSFQWKDLEGATLLADHGGQPLVMLRYALRCQRVEWARVRVVNAGSPEQMSARFRAGEGDYIHQQGPAAQQLQRDGIGYTVASVGEAMPEVAFSSLAASREFLATEEARRFTRAYRRARQWVREAPPREVARAEAALFPETAPEALEAAVAQYQKLGCWSGDMNIALHLYEQALRVFLSQRAVRREHPYEAVVVDPPAAF